VTGEAIAAHEILSGKCGGIPSTTLRSLDGRNAGLPATLRKRKLMGLEMGWIWLVACLRLCSHEDVALFCLSVAVTSLYPALLVATLPP
jgi:hypothetical protein